MNKVVSLKAVADANFLQEQVNIYAAYQAACRNLDNRCYDLMPDQYDPNKAHVQRRAWPHLDDTRMMYPNGIAIHFDRALTAKEQALLPKELPLVYDNRMYGCVPVIIGKHDVGAPR